MILVDTSVWIDHLRNGDPSSHGCSRTRSSSLTPGWSASSSLRHLTNRREVLGLLSRLPQAVVATDAEVLTVIEGAPLHGLGIGWVDAQLLTAVRLTPDARLWTRDTRLARAGARLGAGIHSDPR